MPTPTDEQTAAADRFHAGDHLALQAGAGTGKTSTLALLAHGTRRHGRYIAYNKAIAQDAASRFPSTVTCKTAHALAYAAIGHRYHARLNSPRRPSWKTGHHLGITKTHRLGDRDLSPRALSYATLRTVTRFCHSADPALTDHHVPRLRNLEDAGHHRELTALVLPFARTAWADLQNPDTGAVRFDHDHYLKIWALTEPRIPADFLLLDEAQDTNPVVEQVFNAQRDHAQLVMVGDSAQAIYQWRGARDIMTAFRGTALTLTQSFRFGPDLATEANRWLSIATAPLRLAGTESVPTTLGPVDQPDAILCRTNVGAMREVMQLLDTDHRVALTGGGESLRALARAADDLRAGRRTFHPELLLFPTWGDLQDYAANDPAGRDLQPLVDLVDTHGTDAILNAVYRLDPESAAHVTVSTAHKSKGREWASVKIADDFTPPRDTDKKDANGRPVPAPIDEAEARLAYVAVTRARRRLDLGGLSWIHDHPDGTSPA
ncbi:UvrD-helicase domain-containing protein [Streptomyces microflavus]|uniref:UvrD-helicase domain-containing protein n=1 Tax=Streptomyces microflavus TaxID=1919 RepID=UPI002E153597|nr:UvrD-helicase domain-containing protein [Streptomyces microflavus]WSR88949.1 UvrD-helicase domain-containing protein [Streptomyces microflavus]WSR95833.1 UvrD-helicase domain-containing protein [Streptomyces microflavus]